LRDLNRDSLPHLFSCLVRSGSTRWDTFWARLAAWWWGVSLGRGCAFRGRPQFRRNPGSAIVIGQNCMFNSSATSNWIGVNRPCMVSTLKEGAEITIREGCGFSGTVVWCAKKIILGRNVRCGANTLICDTDGHSDDPRTGLDVPVEIGDNAWLGVNVIVLKGVTIGEGTMVGAGSLVTRSLPAHVVAAGVPARVIREIKAREGF